jgi:hypothetical protein
MPLLYQPADWYCGLQGSQLARTLSSLLQGSGLIFLFPAIKGCVVFSNRVQPFSSCGQEETGPRLARSLGSRYKMWELSVQEHGWAGRKFFARHLSYWRAILVQRSCQLRKSWGLRHRGQKTFDLRSGGEAAGGSGHRHGELESGVWSGRTSRKSTSEADTAPSPGCWWGLRESFCSLGCGTPSLFHPVSCRQLRPRYARSPHVVVILWGFRL